MTRAPHSSLRSTPVGARRRAGYTLIEIVGVAAILAVLIAVVAEQVFRRMVRAERQAESITLDSIAESYLGFARRLHQIPGNATWAGVVAQELEEAPDRVTETRTGRARTFLIDPALRIGASLNATNTLPYVQTVAGSAVEPVSPRVLVISCVTHPLPTLTAADFDTLWATPDNQVPAGWGADWAGRGEDIRIQRVNLRPLFHRLVLNNLDPVRTAQYSLNNQLAAGIVSLNQRAAWFLEGTRIDFRLVDGTLQASEFLNEDSSYVFENGYWRRFPSDRSWGTLKDFGAWVEEFLKAPAPPVDPNQFGASQQVIVEEFYTYLWTYAVWGTDNPYASPPYTAFSYGGSSSSQQFPYYRVVSDSRARLGDFTANLLKK